MDVKEKILEKFFSNCNELHNVLKDNNLSKNDIEIVLYNEREQKITKINRNKEILAISLWYDVLKDKPIAILKNIKSIGSIEYMLNKNSTI